MGRYRSPQPAQSPYITAAGYQRLEQEARAIWERRREVVQALSAAAAEGDRSENAEYIYRKKQLREMDRRIRYLQRRLPDLKVVRSQSTTCDQVFFGAWITLEDEAGGEQIYRIVGADEFDPKLGWISVDSPVARALLQRRLDDSVSVETPSGPRVWVITSIRYGEP
ncbi:MAG: transcription elongation factor GreB [Gammaproteobacteria bacterium]|nr:transcription elongation factor GreB [Gammaproteobacteria bacterium]